MSFFKGIHSTRVLKGLIMPSLQVFNTQETSALKLVPFTKQRHQARHVIIVITNFQQALSKTTEETEPPGAPFFLTCIPLPPSEINGIDSVLSVREM